MFDLPRPFVFALLLLSGACTASPQVPVASADKPESSQEGIENGLAWSEPIPDTPAQTARKSRSGSRPPPKPDEVALRYPRSQTPWLGVELRATDAEAPGVKISRVVTGSPAARAHLQTGDVLLKMGEVPMQTPTEVASWVRAQAPDSIHPLMILRQGQQKLLKVELKGTPEFEDRLRLALVGRPAPEIAGVATFQGEASSLGELRGQVVVLEFWASYCGVCRFLAPVLDEWHRSYKPQGGHVIGITVDPPGRGLQAAQKTGMHYTLASDVNGAVSRTYMATQIPAVFIIDRSGIVRDVMVGYSRRRIEETESLIQELLKDEY